MVLCSELKFKASVKHIYMLGTKYVSNKHYLSATIPILAHISCMLACKVITGLENAAAEPPSLPSPLLRYTRRERNKRRNRDQMLHQSEFSPHCCGHAGRAEGSFQIRNSNSPNGKKNHIGLWYRERGGL